MMIKTFFQYLLLSNIIFLGHSGVVADNEYYDINTLFNTSPILPNTFADGQSSTVDPNQLFININDLGYD